MKYVIVKNNKMSFSCESILSSFSHFINDLSQTAENFTDTDERILRTILLHDN